MNSERSVPETELTSFSIYRFILGIPSWGYGRWMNFISCIASYSYFHFGEFQAMIQAKKEWV